MNCSSKNLRWKSRRKEPVLLLSNAFVLGTKLIAASISQPQKTKEEIPLSFLAKMLTAPHSHGLMQQKASTAIDGGLLSRESEIRTRTLVSYVSETSGTKRHGGSLDCRSGWASVFGTETVWRRWRRLNSSNIFKPDGYVRPGDWDLVWLHQLPASLTLTTLTRYWKVVIIHRSIIQVLYLGSKGIYQWKYSFGIACRSIAVFVWFEIK